MTFRFVFVLMLGLLGLQQAGHARDAHFTIAAETGTARLALPAPQQVVANWGVNTYKHGGTMSAIEHINYRHAFESGFSNVSRFAEEASVRNIRSFVDDALRYGEMTPQGATGFKFEYNLGRAIGTNQSGGAV